jgi:CheY-like chemotaxis protein
MPKVARSSVARPTPALWKTLAARNAGSRASLSRMRCRRPTLLWIDDYRPGLEMYRAMFEALGFSVVTASSGEEGLQLASLNNIDVAITDYEMPEMNGEAVAIALKSLKPNTPILMFSGSTFVSDRARLVVDAFCDKAGSREELLAAIHFLLGKKRPGFLQPQPVTRASHHGQTVA